MRRSAVLLPLVAILSIAADAPTGYLAPGAVDLTQVIPLPPVKGDIRYEADRQVFRATRAMLSTPRGRLATDDVAAGVPAVMKDFSCAAGITLSPTATPATYRVLANANADTSRVNNVAKDHWQRLRPFLIDKGPVCDDKAALAKSYDYPSGHSTRGWTFGLILSELLPDRAGPILARGRAYGESRIVCGAHNMSAIEAGRAGATVTMQSVRVTPAYQADLAAAKAELAAARSSGTAPDAASCSAEAALTRTSVLAGLKK